MRSLFFIYWDRQRIYIAVQLLMQIRNETGRIRKPGGTVQSVQSWEN